MARKRTGVEPCGIAMTPEMAQRLRVMAATKGISRSALIVEILQSALDNRLTPVAGDGAEAADSAGASNSRPAPEHDG